MDEEAKAVVGKPGFIGHGFSPVFLGSFVGILSFAS
jgi:hypothetical protein